jgi:hypothetical protein
LAVTGNANTALVIAKDGDADPVPATSWGGEANFAVTKGNLAVKWRINPGADPADPWTTVPFIYGKAGFLDGQFVITVGKIDGATWQGDYDAAGIARFEFKPSALAGLSLGFWLPKAEAGDAAAAVPVPAYTVGEYFQEMGFGITFAPANIVEAKLGIKLDSDWGTKEGVKLAWAAHPTFVKTAVTGLSVEISGNVTGLGVTDGVATGNTFKVAYSLGSFSAALPFNFNTYAKSAWATGKTKFNIAPELSYLIIPEIKAGLNAGMDFYSFDPAGDLEAFDKVNFKPYVEIKPGNGLIVTPSLLVTIWGENAKTSGANGDSSTDIEFGLAFKYEF